jgi:hypothetical protein
MADVIAFRLVGRFDCTRKMLPISSVTISSIADVLVPLVNSLHVELQGGSRRPRVKLRRVFLCFRLTTTVPQILVTILNGTIATGMIVPLYRCRTARLR